MVFVAFGFGFGFVAIAFGFDVDGCTTCASDVDAIGGAGAISCKKGQVVATLYNTHTHIFLRKAKLTAVSLNAGTTSVAVAVDPTLCLPFAASDVDGEAVL